MYPRIQVKKKVLGNITAQPMTQDSSLRFRCTQCSAKIEAESALAGALVKCPKCAASIFVPLLSTSTTEAPQELTARLVGVELKIRCPSCQDKLSIDARASQWTVVCPACGNTLAVPRIPPYPDILLRTTAKEAAGKAGATNLLTDDEVAFLMAPMPVIADEKETADALS